MVIVKCDAVAKILLWQRHIYSFNPRFCLLLVGNPIASINSSLRSLFFTLDPLKHVILHVGLELLDGDSGTFHESCFHDDE